MYKNFSFAPRVQNKGRTTFLHIEAFNCKSRMQPCEALQKHSGSKGLQQRRRAPLWAPRPPLLSLFYLFKHRQTLFPLEGLGHQTLVTHAILTPNNKNQKITHNEISNPKDVVCSGAWGPMLVFWVTRLCHNIAPHYVSSKHSTIIRVGSPGSESMRLTFSYHCRAGLGQLH